MSTTKVRPTKGLAQPPVEPAERLPSARTEPVPYSAPRIIDLGRALDLVQGNSQGKHYDGYSGYWWNEEGG